jgi:uncharacterized spore protein YtfJ
MEHQRETEVERAEPLRALGERLASTATVERLYGSPVEREGVTVIPVARVRYGFGAGTSREEDEEELGGGGGVQATPIGFIVMEGEHAEFRQIRDRAGESLGVAAIVAAAGLGLWFGLRGFAAVMKSSKKR